MIFGGGRRTSEVVKEVLADLKGVCICDGKGHKYDILYMQIEKCQHGKKVKLSRFLTLAHFSMDVGNTGSSGPHKIVSKISFRTIGIALELLLFIFSAPFEQYLSSLQSRSPMSFTKSAVVFVVLVGTSRCLPVEEPYPEVAGEINR